MLKNHLKWLLNELPTLVAKGIIDPSSSDQIKKYYQEQTKSFPVGKIAFALFSILGSVLVGGGIILLFAHNWENLSRMNRTVIVLMPLFISQLGGIFILIKKIESFAIRESVGLFNGLMMGFAIAMVAQTYHIPSSGGTFYLAWGLAILPTFYLLRSHLTSLLYLALIITWTSYQIDLGNPWHPIEYLALVLAYAPYYLYHLNKTPSANLLVLMEIGFMVALSNTFSFYVYQHVNAYLFPLVASSLVTFFYLLDSYIKPSQMKFWFHPFKWVSFLSASILMITLSYPKAWKMFKSIDLQAKLTESFQSSLFLVLLTSILFIGIAYFYFNKLKKGINDFNKNITELYLGILPLVVLVGYFIYPYSFITLSLYFMGLVFIYLVLPSRKNIHPLFSFFTLFFLGIFIGIQSAKGYSPISLWLVAYTAFIVYLILESKFLIEKTPSFLLNLYKLIVFPSTLIFLYSFTFTYQNLYRIKKTDELMLGMDNLLVVLILIGSLIKLYPYFKTHKYLVIFLGALPMGLFFSHLTQIHYAIFTNIYLLAVGIGITFLGTQKAKLSVSNGGLLIIIILVLTRFFDTNMTFVARGIIFILLGIFFIGFNIYFHKRYQRNIN